VSLIRIRFNRDHTSHQDVWRIFEDDKEHRVSEFVVAGVELSSDTTIERGEQKWNVRCEGELTIENGRAYIRKPNARLRAFVDRLNPVFMRRRRPGHKPSAAVSVSS
jgi:hypothetical protein